MYARDMSQGGTSLQDDTKFPFHELYLEISSHNTSCQLNLRKVFYTASCIFLLFVSCKNGRAMLRMMRLGKKPAHPYSWTSASVLRRQGFLEAPHAPPLWGPGQEGKGQSSTMKKKNSASTTAACRPAHIEPSCAG